MARRFDKAREYTEKYKSVLVPCKYCGCTHITIVSDRGLSGNGQSWSVVCETSGCDYANDTSVKRAIEKWNDRHRQVEEEK